MLYKPQKNNNFLVVLGAAALLVAGLVGYGYVSTSRVQATNENLAITPEPHLLQSPFSPEQLVILTKIESLKLDDALLKDETFLSLQDWTVELAPEEVGKTNPFAPFGFSEPSKNTPRAPRR